MWQEAKANDKRIRELMVDHKKRAERRRAYYESRLGDPLQLIRVIGSASKLYPDAEQFYYYENTDNFMPWQASPDIKIDRFDGRSLLDYLPEPNSRSRPNKEEEEMTDELNFERYHDLIEAERLEVSEKERLAEVEEEWTKLLDRHQAKLNMIRQQEKGSSRGNHHGFDYGTRKVTEDSSETMQLLKQEDILQHVDDLSEKDKQTLNAMSSKYGIRSYARLLRVAKKDRDDELRSLRRKQQEGKPKTEKSEHRRRRRRKRRRYSDREEDEFGRMERGQSGRHSPSYEPYRQGSESESTSAGSSDSEDDRTRERSQRRGSDEDNVVIEFGSSGPAEEQPTQDQTPTQTIHTPSTQSIPVQEKKLTPMEKLKLKMRQGLQKQIVSDEKDRRKKEKEREIESLQALARNQGLPIHTYLRPEPPTRKEVPQERYRSPSTSSDEQQKEDRQASPKRTYRRSPSPDRKRSSEQRQRHRSPSVERRRHRSPSVERRRHRSPSVERRRHRSPSVDRDHRRRSSPDKRRSSRDKRRHSSSSDRHRRSPARHHRRHRSPSSSPDRSYHKKSHHRSNRSPSYRKQRYRSPSTEDEKKKRR